jgi:uncharacterized cupin superfamily protein
VNLLKKADKFLVLPFVTSQLKKQLSRQPSAVSRQPSAVSRSPDGRREGAVHFPIWKTHPGMYEFQLTIIVVALLSFPTTDNSLAW